MAQINLSRRSRWPAHSYSAQRAERLREVQTYRTLHEAAQLTRARVAEEQQLQLKSRHRRYREHRHDRRALQSVSCAGQRV